MVREIDFLKQEIKNKNEIIVLLSSKVNGETPIINKPTESLPVPPNESYSWQTVGNPRQRKPQRSSGKLATQRATVPTQNRFQLFSTEEETASSSIVIEETLCNATKKRPVAVPSEHNTVSTANNDQALKTTRNSNKKRSTTILGDSIVRNIKGREMKRCLGNKENVYVKSFSGATVQCMESYAIPSSKHQPECIILHAGTNDLRSSKSEVEIASSIVELATSLKTDTNDVMVSGLIPRADSLEVKRSRTNHVLYVKCCSMEITFIDNDNIDSELHLSDKVHLNPAGDIKLANNLLTAIRY